MQAIHLGLRRLRSLEDYQTYQSFIARETIRELAQRGIAIGGCATLEIAAGAGGYSQVLDQAARSFYASDLRVRSLFAVRGIKLVQLDAVCPLPIKSNSFDLVFCSNLIEHIAEPAALLENVHRILRDHGVFCISFPPFYSLTMNGGHQYKPFHFLGEGMAIRLINTFKGRSYWSYATTYCGFGLFPRKIDEVKQQLRGAGFTVQETYTRLSPINTARFAGLIKDLTTWHVCYLARKPSA